MAGATKVVRLGPDGHHHHEPPSAIVTTLSVGSIAASDGGFFTGQSHPIFAHADVRYDKRVDNRRTPVVLGAEDIKQHLRRLSSPVVRVNARAR